MTLRFPARSICINGHICHFACCISRFLLYSRMFYLLYTLYEVQARAVFEQIPAKGKQANSLLLLFLESKNTPPSKAPSLYSILLRAALEPDRVIHFVNYLLKGSSIIMYTSRLMIIFAPSRRYSPPPRPLPPLDPPCSCASTRLWKPRLDRPCPRTSTARISWTRRDC